VTRRAHAQIGSIHGGGHVFIENNKFLHELIFLPWVGKMVSGTILWRVVAISSSNQCVSNQCVCLCDHDSLIPLQWYICSFSLWYFILHQPFACIRCALPVLPYRGWRLSGSQLHRPQSSLDRSLVVANVIMTGDVYDTCAASNVFWLWKPGLF
jgi:hypothetical protein